MGFAGIKFLLRQTTYSYCEGCSATRMFAARRCERDELEGAKSGCGWEWILQFLKSGYTVDMFQNINNTSC